VLSYGSDLNSLYFIIWAKVYVVQMKPAMGEGVVSPRALRCRSHWRTGWWIPSIENSWVAAGITEPLQPRCLCLTQIYGPSLLSLGGGMCELVSFEEPCRLEDR
jgi:hypothetical protein